MRDFKIRILDQYWISKNPDDRKDLCSHGLIELVIGDVIVSNESDIDWTISTSGLMLLRSINVDHIVDGDYPIINHCGQLGMIGCPISIDWTIKSNDNEVCIEQVKKYPSTNREDVINFKGVNVRVERKKFIREIVRFCDDIKEFFKGKKREFRSDYDKKEWLNFWSEFDKLLDKHRSELKS